MNEIWDAIVIGGGAAGLSAALMLGRSRRRVLVIDHGRPRNRFAAHMHGVLGHDGLDPAELLARGRAEIARYGVRLRTGAVEQVDQDGAALLVRLAGAGPEAARAVIVATGVRDELPAIPGLAERWGSTVLHCPYCHGWEVRDRHFGVLATSAMSLHQTELVRQWTDRVTLFSAGAGSLDPEVEKRLLSRGVSLVRSEVVEVLGEGDRVTAVRTADGEQVAVDAIFTGGVLRPHDDFLAGLGLARTENPVGSFLAVDPTGRTSHPRIWAVGNVSNPMGNVPMAIAAGATAGAMVNATLVGEEFDDAVGAAA